MAKKVNAINNSTRNTVLINYGEKLISGKKKSKKKKLLEIIKSNSGRNNQGKITTRHKGGRHKRYYRIIDFKRYSKDGIEGKIESIEYDPNRNCFISLVSYNDGSFSFILSPEGVKLGDKIVSGESDNIPIKPGNNLPLSLIPVNTPIHNLEMKPKKGGELIRSAGS
jgi:large subunit ribosomal protein L2